MRLRKPGKWSRADRGTKESPLTDTLIRQGRISNLILFNDEVNTFDHVIECLMEICGHSAEQAEQCALITHTKGKCAVKEGPVSKLEPLCSELNARGLTSEVH